MNDLVKRTLFPEFDRMALDFLRPTYHSAPPTASSTPRFSISKTEDVYRIVAEMPGFQASDVEVEYEDGKLSVHGTREWDEIEGTSLISEIQNQVTFKRTFKIPDLNIDEAQAELNRGIFELTIPIAAAAKPKRITVREGREDGE